MIKRLVSMGFMLYAFASASVFSQTRSAFSGDLTKYTTELRAFMGPNLNPDQTANLQAFIVKWDSAVFKNDIMVKVADI
jgi:hypothetical protein